MHKIGILGGTFNPIHLGHVDMGLRIREAFDLDFILYVLSARPPHKRSRAIPPAAARYEMLQKALFGYAPHLVPCDVELHRPEPSYTITTLRLLETEYPQSQFYFISGSEGFLKIRTWRDYRTVLRLVFFIVVLRRPGHDREVTAILAKEGIPCRNGPAQVTGPPAAFLFQYESPLLPLSSTRVRRLARTGRDVSKWVAPEVGAIMEAMRLYEGN